MSLPGASQLYTQPQSLPCSWQPELQEHGIWAAHGRGGRPGWAGFGSVCLQLLSGLLAVRQHGRLCRSLPLSAPAYQLSSEQGGSGGGVGLPQETVEREDLQWPRARNQEILHTPKPGRQVSFPLLTSSLSMAAPGRDGCPDKLHMKTHNPDSPCHSCLFS